MKPMVSLRELRRGKKESGRVGRDSYTQMCADDQGILELTFTNSRQGGSSFKSQFKQEKNQTTYSSFHFMPSSN